MAKRPKPLLLLVHVGGSKPLPDGGNLGYRAPTMPGVQQPSEMTGRSLIGQ